MASRRGTLSRRGRELSSAGFETEIQRTPARDPALVEVVARSEAGPANLYSSNLGLPNQPQTSRFGTPARQPNSAAEPREARSQLTKRPHVTKRAGRSTGGGLQRLQSTTADQAVDQGPARRATRVLRSSSEQVEPMRAGQGKAEGPPDLQIRPAPGAGLKTLRPTLLSVTEDSFSIPGPRVSIARCHDSGSPTDVRDDSLESRSRRGR